RRTPATYDRIIKHIKGHRIIVHCTVTRQQVNRSGYLDEFLRFWSAMPETRKIWISLYTPQIGEVSEERLLPADRRQVVADLRATAQTQAGCSPIVDISPRPVHFYSTVDQPRRADRRRVRLRVVHRVCDVLHAKEHVNVAHDRSGRGKIRDGITREAGRSNA